MKRSVQILFLSLLLAGGAVSYGAAAVVLPDPLVDEPLAAMPSQRVAILAGGCFWGVEAVFEHLKGVVHVSSGYSGGTASTAEYELVAGGRTKHAESVRVVYDPSQISYGRILKVFFSVAHNPTELNRQGPDVGPQYRSAIFFADAEQERIAREYINQLEQAKAFKHRIVTQIVKLNGFYEAEGYHQDFVARYPSHPYVMFHDLPKLSDLKKEFPTLYRKP